MMTMTTTTTTIHLDLTCGNALVTAMTSTRLLSTPIQCDSTVTQMQGSYRNMTVVFHDFQGQNYFIFQTFQGILYPFL